MPRWAGKYPSYLMLPAGNKIFPSALLILPLRTDRLSDRALGGQIRGAAVRHIVLPKQQPAAPRAPGITRAVWLPRPLRRSEPSLLLIVLTQLKSRLSTVLTRCKEREGEEMGRKKIINRRRRSSEIRRGQAGEITRREIRWWGRSHTRG